MNEPRRANTNRAVTAMLRSEEVVLSTHLFRKPGLTGDREQRQSGVVFNAKPKDLFVGGKARSGDFPLESCRLAAGCPLRFAISYRAGSWTEETRTWSLLYPASEKTTQAIRYCRVLCCNVSDFAAAGQRTASGSVSCHAGYRSKTGSLAELVRAAAKPTGAWRASAVQSGVTCTRILRLVTLACLSSPFPSSVWQITRSKLRARQRCTHAVSQTFEPSSRQF